MKRPIQHNENEGMEIRPYTDQLQKVKKGLPPGVDVDPVDAFGGYVAVDKYAKDNLEETQENIGWKVGLEPSLPFDSEEVS